MGSLAVFLHEQGYSVTGSDIADNKVTRSLKNKGIEIYNTHEASHVFDRDIVVFSTAISPENVELTEAIKQEIKVMHRAEMLSFAVRNKERIIVSGTHGKTTTAAMLTSVLFLNDQNPSFVIGGEIIKAHKSASYTSGESVVVEADESDGSLRSFCADIGIITNIEAEHLDYYKDQTAIEQVFLETVNKSASDSLWLCCYDDEAIVRLAKNTNRKIVGYGFSEDAYVKARNIKFADGFMEYDYWQGDKLFGKIKLNVIGKHNVLNSLPVIYIALNKGISFEKIAASMKRLSGIGRRMEIKFADDKNTLINDYAHHPTEVRATIAALRDMFAGKRLVCVFQPHRYSRMLRFENDFAASFLGVDKLYISDIYSAGEPQMSAISSNSLAEKIIKSENVKDVLYIPSFDNIRTDLMKSLKAEDVVCFMGAGDIGRACEDFMKDLKG